MTGKPIGVFDSGVGGLSVLRELRRLLPNYDLTYLGDQGWAPYGERNTDDVVDRCMAITDFLIEQGAGLIVVACNTATIAAIELLRSHYAMTFVGTEPAVQPAARHTKTGTVGVLATVTTLKGNKYNKLLERSSSGVRVISQPCPGLAAFVESGNVEGTGALRAVEPFLTPLLEAGADSIVLGSTHYAFVRPAVEMLCGKDIAVFDSAGGVARQTARLLAYTDAEEGGSLNLWSSGTQRARDVMERLWGEPVGTQTFSS